MKTWKYLLAVVLFLAISRAQSAAAHELPDTGQVISYTPTFGEDHDYQPASAQPSYTDNGDGTTNDNRTGLMWVKDGSSAGCNNGNSLTWEAALNFCEGLTFAGHSDWRLPNRRELFSIIDFGQAAPPMINPGFFPNTLQQQYATSTTYVPDTTNAWVVSYYFGNVTFAPKSVALFYVRCVRAGP